ncbi:MAG: hypothetical protein RBR41_03115 [Desulfovibrio sp.]|uniref:hypothetical protein n=1 Tax=Desulfovibrio sp. TaxID=885 RepID=UPI002A37069E|nr:hypothetical protein [Desulfovibrio sp.]MDY0258641.1 hypothetical protein [Desulfovibrio sp.]
MARAIKPFAVISASGSMLFMEGQEVPEHVAKQYPEHIEGTAAITAPTVHNPNLKAKMTKAEVGKMPEDDLMQWLRQFHPASVPAEAMEKKELVELVLTLS